MLSRGLWHDGDVTQALLPPLEDAWSDFARSRARKGRSVHTLNIYRKSYEQFWRWAETEGLPPDPGAVTRRHVNAWTSAMLVAPLVRNGSVTFDVDPDTGDRVPRPIQPNTVRIRWQNLRPFFSWWAEEMEEPNPFDKADVPRLEERPVPVVALDDVRAMLHACAGTDFEARRDTAIIRFLIDTGARVGELVGMTVDSWDRRQDLVTLTGKTGTRIVPDLPVDRRGPGPLRAGPAASAARGVQGALDWRARPAERQRGGADAQPPRRPGRGTPSTPPRVPSLMGARAEAGRSIRGGPDGIGRLDDVGHGAPVREIRGDRSSAGDGAADRAGRQALRAQVRQPLLARWRRARADLAARAV